MFKKRFVSLVFSSKRVQVLLMDLKDREVISHSTIPLPSGTIVNNKVRDSEKLSDLLKAEFEKQKIKEKNVGIVIPEFSTYIRSVKLPKIEKGDLDEAVRWQSQDFLPNTEQEMLMDWRIVNEGDASTEVLAAAIRKDVLNGYISAVSKCGFYPMVVETPSLSLSRIVGQEKQAKLIIYVYYDEAVLVLVRDSVILATSVANSHSQREIINSAGRIIKHYQSINVSSVVLGGADLAEDFRSNVERFIGIPVEDVETKFKNIKEEEVQEYLIALSLQLKDPARPEDEHTINLLPKNWERVYKNRIKNLELWSVTMIFSVVLWGVLLASFATYTLLNVRINEFGRQIESASNAEAQKVYDEVSRINSLSDKIINIKNSKESPIELMNLVNSTRPDQVSLNRYHIDMEKGTIGVSGVSLDRKSLVDWKLALEGQEEFVSVLLPPSSYIEEANINFEMGINFKSQETKSVPKLKL